MNLDSEQLTLDIPGLGTLLVEPTIAMREGDQDIWQCSWCGTVVVRSNVNRYPGRLGTCPSCRKPCDWWRQTLPVAGLAVAESLEAAR